ncbi:uncharacterized protein LOC131981894 [Centropristis striata]|uniref:uncharacterized protein LOC131981894 n=1 Tax=Centropristis striata TaxID=184440 RepID=UPI0027E06873|nr:uncharacterized protein LOC131981894 [Centropristis striata]
MEEGGVLLLLLLAQLGTPAALSFYGDSISVTHPQKRTDGTFKVTFHHRQNGRSSCGDQTSFSCEGDVCTSLDESAVLQTDGDTTGQDRWCFRTVDINGILSISPVGGANMQNFNSRGADWGSGCCWASNVEGETDWRSQVDLDLGRRSDSHGINSCPVTTTVSSLRVPQNCFSTVHLLAHDPDGDHVRCRFYNTTPANFTMDEASCTLAAAGQVAVGVHVLELTLEDFPSKNVTLTYADGTSVLREASDMNAPSLCKVKLQFSLEILPAIPNCEAGHVRPMFLSRTPSHGDVLYASVGQSFQLHAEAQAHHTSIHDFQVSGPQNMTKVFTDGAFGKAVMTLSWTPHHSDLYRFVPVCFTAETNETQSDMRCVVVMVTQASIIQGRATVTCSPNKMMVALEKASMPGVDENFLTMRDPSCSLTSNSTHITGMMSFTACGTRLEDKGDFLVFTNEINSFELPSEVIVRRRKVKIDVSCQFPKTISISSYYNLHKTDYIFTESTFGSFGYTFEIYQDSNFTEKVAPSAYPVEVNLLDNIYMGIQAESDLVNVDLFVESCKATPDDNPENSLSYDLIKNGCLEDETIIVHPSNPTSYKFQVQAFKFTGNFDQVYITCSVILCERGSSFSRCAQGCLAPSSRRRKRTLSKETFGHYITQGPLQFVGPAFPNAAVEENSRVIKWKNAVAPELRNSPDVAPGAAAEQRNHPAAAAVNLPPLTDSGYGDKRLGVRELLSSNASTVAFACMFLVSLLLMAAAVAFLMRKRRAEDRKSLLVSGWEN